MYASLNYYKTTFIDNGYYSENVLYKTITKDENWTGNDDHTTQEFKDKEGRIVLKRTFENNVPHDTYYVYDQFGNLTYVLPPLVDTSNGVSSIDLEGLCYQYKYDYRNRLVEKKLPGRQKEYIVYDNLDRVVATGPVQSPFNDFSSIGFMITKYDDFNRVVYTGWTELVDYSGDTSIYDYRQDVNQSIKISEVRSQTQTLDGIAINYSKLVFPYNDIYLLTVNYYDDYNFPDHNEISGAVFGNPVLVNTKGLATGSWVRVPTSVSSMLSEKVSTTYDNKLRPIAVNKTNSMGGYTNSKTQYSFIGQVLHTETEHKKNSSFVAITINEDFTYSPQGRLIDLFHQIDDNDIERIATNRYSNLGQLIHKFVGGANDVGLQKVDYSYNIRGWLKEINKLSDLTETNVPTDLFAFKINYNAVDNDLGGTVLPLYNGNISETFWKTSSDNVTRKYGYQYDALNRLNKATYQKPNFPVQVTNSYNEEISYDANGNILNLRRNGELDDQGMALPIDDLEYRYDQSNPNQLIKVTDYTYNPSGFSDDLIDTNDVNNDYKYDDYGNMIRDDNKNIKNIVYNHLNLPILIDFGALGRISYIYNAVGQKISKKVVDANLNTTVETFYVDGFQYKGDNLQFFPHAEGYVNCNAPKLLLVPTSDGGLQEVYLDDGTPTFSYVYNYTDHLGNIRLSYTKNPQSAALSIIEENHYYPFGLKHNNYNSDKSMYIKEQEQLKIKPVPPLFKPAYNYKYQGQERQDELGLNWDSFKWRNYDYSIGRFMSIDPLAEKYPYNGTYNFAENRVIDGRELEGLEWVNSKNELIYDPPSKDCKGEYTSAATKNDKNLGNALLGTKTGTEQFNKLVNADHKIEVVLNEGKGPEGEAGKTNNGEFPLSYDMTTGKPDGAEVEKSTITLYMGTIGGLADAEKNGEVGTLNKDYGGLSTNGMTFSQIIGAVFGHEIEHTTDENAILQSLGKPNKDTEKKPTQISNKIINESKQ